jgi:hypothetical protein
LGSFSSSPRTCPGQRQPQPGRTAAETLPSQNDPDPKPQTPQVLAGMAGKVQDVIEHNRRIFERRMRAEARGPGGWVGGPAGGGPARGGAAAEGG